jgi:hypothetical protein
MDKDDTQWRILARETVQLAEAGRVLREFQRRGILTIALKGAALVGRVYSPGERPMCDIDLLLRDGDLKRAEDVLRRLGYGFLPDSAGVTLAFARTYMGQVPYHKGLVIIELHYHLIASRWLREATAVDEPGLWERALPMEIAGAPALRLGVEDELIHLCVHTAVHHGLAHRSGYRDILGVIRVEDWIDWPALACRARAWRVSVPCWAALAVARELEPEFISRAALNALNVPRWRQALLRPFLERARLEGPVLVSGRMRFLGLLLIDRLCDLPRVIWGGLFPGRRWIETRFELSPRAARWRQVTYPLEVLARGLGAIGGIIR